MSIDFINDRVFLGKMRSTSADIVNQLVQLINKEGKMRVKQQLVGSGDKNLITQNGNEPVDLDYNLIIIWFGKFRKNGDEKYIKEYVKKKFNEILKRNEWSPCSDKTSVLKTEERAFIKGNKTPFKIDLAIVYKNEYGWQRLIHNTRDDSWFWNQARDSKELEMKEDFIKANDEWSQLRDRYREKKIMYQNDHNHPSFVCYIEAVNDVYNTLKNRPHPVRGFETIPCITSIHGQRVIF